MTPLLKLSTEFKPSEKQKTLFHEGFKGLAKLRFVKLDMGWMAGWSGTVRGNLNVKVVFISLGVILLKVIKVE